MATRVGHTGILRPVSGTWTFPTPEGTQAGDILIVYVSDDNGSSVFADASGLFTHVVVADGVGGSGRPTEACAAGLFHHVLAGTPAASYAFTTTGGDDTVAGAIMVVYRAGDGETYEGLTTDTFIATGGANDTGAMSLAAVGDPSVLVAFFSNDGNMTVSTPPAGMTELDVVVEGSSACAAYEAINPSGDPLSPTLTWSGSEQELGAAVLLEFEGGGGGDETAPTLSSATATATGQTTADLSVTTDEEADVYVVVTTSSTTPTAEQIEAGQDHTGAAAAFSDSEPGASAGAVPFSATGLDPATEYWAHFWAEDEAENSATPVTSSSFTTDAVPTLTAEGADLEMEGGEITLTHVTQGTIASTVTLGGQPVEGATVRLYNQTDDTYEGDTTTDESGAYAFEGLALAKKYHAFVEYEADGVLYHAPSQPGLRPVAD